MDGYLSIYRYKTELEYTNGKLPNCIIMPRINYIYFMLKSNKIKIPRKLLKKTFSLKNISDKEYNKIIKIIEEIK